MAKGTVHTGPVTIYSGQAELLRPGIPMQKKDEPALPFGFFLPEVEPLGADEPEPEAVVGQAWLMRYATSATRYTLGIEELRATYAPDPRGGPARWLALEGTAYPGFGILIGYQVTVQRPR